MTEERKYIYSIIKNTVKAQTPYNNKLYTEQGSGSANFLGGILGIGNRAVTIVSFQDLAAIVSNTNLISFDKFDKKELTQFIAAHERVNAEFMKNQDVIPMRFGIIAESAAEIRNILAKAYIQFKAAIERIAGKVEFIVQVFWNEKNILEKPVQENIEIQKLKKEVESRGKILGFSSKMKLGKRIFEAIEACRKEYFADILGNLATYFPDFSAGKLLDANKEGAADKTDKEMIMNYSFLVGKTEEPVLESLLNKLAEKYEDKLYFKYIGPMAPYSFAAINLSLGNFDLVDNARKTLRLGEAATVLATRDAYHKLAQEYHPDKHEYKKDQVILEEAEKKIKDIITANEVLTVYCKHYLSALAPEKEQLCSFRKEDVEDSIIIKEN